MGKISGSRHLKRKPAPRFWPIHRKEFTWTIKPLPGPHSQDHSLPLGIIVRDILGFARTLKEAKKIISKGNVLVNGRARKEEAFPLGLMDVISIPNAKASWRVLTDKKGLALHPIKKDEASFRLCRIENKTIVSQGGVQLNLHDGNTLLVRFAEPSEDAFKPLDVIRLGISSGEVEDHLKLGKAAFALITGGKNRGKYGKVVEMEKAPGKKRRQLVATVEDFAKERVKTILDFIFVVGGDAPLISLPEVK